MCMKKKSIAIVSVILLILVLGVCLSACNAENFENKLKNKGYNVTVEGQNGAFVMTFNSLLSSEYKGKVEWVVSASKGIDSVKIFKFDNLKDAKTFETSGEYVIYGNKIYRTTTCVIVGTEQGVRDAK